MYQKADERMYDEKSENTRNVIDAACFTCYNICCRVKFTYADKGIGCPQLVMPYEEAYGWQLNQRRNVMSVISIETALKPGVHFGHQTRRWNPKMKPYIYTWERNGIYIIDLQKSVGMVDDAYNAISDIVAKREDRFVGTKKQAQGCY